MDLDQFDIALKVNEAGSLAEAARQLDLDPSVISRQLSNLEHQLNLRLFQRSTRTLSVTEDGAAYFARIAPLVEELRLANVQAGQQQRRAEGVVRLTTSVAYGTERIVPLLPELTQRLPGISLDLTLSDDALDLVATRQDLAIRHAPEPSGDWISRTLHQTPYVLCASPSWSAAHPVATPVDLSKVACLRLSMGHHADEWLFRKAEQIDAIAVKGTLSFSSPVALRQAALQGLGPAILADWLVADALARGALVRLLPAYQVSTGRFESAAYLLSPSRRHVPRKTRAVTDFLIDKLAARSHSHLPLAQESSTAEPDKRNSDNDDQ